MTTGANLDFVTWVLKEEATNPLSFIKKSYSFMEGMTSMIKPSAICGASISNNFECLSISLRAKLREPLFSRKTIAAFMESTTIQT